MANDREKSGALFFVENRATEDDPYATGQCLIEGKEYWMEAWHYEENGLRHMDLRIKLKKGSTRRNGDGDGKITKVKDKTNEKAPDWKGDLQMADGGPKFEVACWRRQASTSGAWFLSVAFQLPGQRSGQRSSSQPTQQPAQQPAKQQDRSEPAF